MDNPSEQAEIFDSVTQDWEKRRSLVAERIHGRMKAYLVGQGMDVARCADVVVDLAIAAADEVITMHIEQGRVDAGEVLH